MKRFEIEHIGITVTEPVEMAHWYQDIVGFNIKFSGQDEEKGVVFLTDSVGKVMLEFGKLPNISALSDIKDHHLQLHIALESDNPDSDSKYLIEKGATFIEKYPMTMPGDYLIVLNDRWNNCIQLVKRKNKLM
ncbi:VOC family protein [candidate division KSB1 bacterium]|nr:VOC family protein [candidate division KSB1 bacterium]